MKPILLLALLVTAFAYPLTWQGKWVVVKGCEEEGCCCPAKNTKLTFSPNPSNQTQVLVSGQFNDNTEDKFFCKSAGWENNKKISWPWSNSMTLSLIEESEYTDDDGIQYSFSVVQLDNGTLSSQFLLDQTAIAGADVCTFTIINTHASITLVSVFLVLISSLLILIL